jgi:hypothetical protein
MIYSRNCCRSLVEEKISAKILKKTKESRAYIHVAAVVAQRPRFCASSDRSRKQVCGTTILSGWWQGQGVRWGVDRVGRVAELGGWVTRQETKRTFIG